MDEGLPDVPAAKKKRKMAAPRASRQVRMSSAIAGIVQPHAELEFSLVNALNQS